LWVTSDVERISNGKEEDFDELMEGVNAMKKHREGKLTLRSCKRRAQKQIAK